MCIRCTKTFSGCIICESDNTGAEEATKSFYYIPQNIFSSEKFFFLYFLILSQKMYKFFCVNNTKLFFCARVALCICMCSIVVVVSEPNGGMRCARLCCPHLQAFCKLQPMTHRMFSTLYVRIKVSVVCGGVAYCAM